MGECHVETYLERSHRQAAGQWRAVAVETASGRRLYETWPYADEAAARRRARRWLRDEYGRAGFGPLFDDGSEQ